MDQRSNSEPRDRRPPTKASTYVPGFGGLRILVSPFMPFNTQTRTTDIMMFNSRNLGALIVDERPHVREWDEPGMGIQNVGIEESYGFGVLNEGQAIAVARNIRVRPNEFSGVAHPWSARDLKSPASRLLRTSIASSAATWGPRAKLEVRPARRWRGPYPAGGGVSHKCPAEVTFYSVNRSARRCRVRDPLPPPSPRNGPEAATDAGFRGLDAWSGDQARRLLVGLGPTSPVLP